MRTSFLAYGYIARALRHQAVTAAVVGQNPDYGATFVDKDKTRLTAWILFQLPLAQGDKAVDPLAEIRRASATEGRKP